MESISINKTSTENYLRELVFMLSVRKELIFFTAVIVFGLVLMVALFWPPNYTTHAQILISKKAVEPSLGSLEQVDYRIEKVSKEDLNSAAELIKSNDLIAQVVIQMAKNSSIFGDIEMTEDQKIDEVWLAKKVEKVIGSLVIDAVPYSKVLNVSLVWSSPDEAKLLLKSLLERYLEYRIEMEGYTARNEFFSMLSNDYLVRIEQTREKLAMVMETHNVVSPAAEIKNNLEIKFSLEKLLGEGQLEQISLEKRIELLSKKIKIKDIQFFSFLENEAITQFSKQIQELFIKKAKTEGVFVSESKAVLGMEMQLDAAYKNLLTEVDALRSQLVAQLDAIQMQNTLLADKVKKIGIRNGELKLARFSMESLENENKVLQQSFETFFKRKEEAELASNPVVNDSDVSILSHPKLPLSASFPNKKVMIPFGFIVACLSGLIIGFLTEFLDHTFKRPEDIEQILALNALISISDIG